MATPFRQISPHIDAQMSSELRRHSELCGMGLRPLTQFQRTTLFLSEVVIFNTLCVLAVSWCPPPLSQFSFFMTKAENVCPHPVNTPTRLQPLRTRTHAHVRTRPCTHARTRAHTNHAHTLTHCTEVHQKQWPGMHRLKSLSILYSRGSA